MSRVKQYVTLENLNVALVLTVLFFGQALLTAGADVADDFLRWMETIRTYGLSQVFEHVQDQYGPGTYLLLALANIVKDQTGLNSYAAFKYVQFGCVLATMVVGVILSRNTAYALLFVLLLATNSVIFGSLDILFTPFLMYAFWALGRGKHALFSGLFMAACLCKYQPLIFAPILAACVLRRLFSAWKESPAQALRLLGVVIVPAALVLGASFVIFGPTWALSGVRALEPGASAMSAFALNTPWLAASLTQILDGRNAGAGGVVGLELASVNAVIISRVLLAVADLALVILYFRRADTAKNLYIFTAAAFLSYFMVSTNVHINHLQAALIPLFLLGIERTERPWLVFWSLLMSVNLMMMFVWQFSTPFWGGGYAPQSRMFFGIDISILFSLISVVCYVAFIVKTYRTDRQIAPEAAPVDPFEETQRVRLAATPG